MIQIKSYDKWLSFYKSKANSEPFFEKEDIIIYDKRKGIFSYQYDEDALYIKLVTGDGEHWQRFAEALCSRLGLFVVLFATRRNPKAWERKFGYHLVRISQGWCIMRKFIEGGIPSGKRKEIPIWK
ncbi:hypothetical protein ALO_12321 [Acetonema longum DSM 6540]|uniref:Uncharacterized protein n=1 Tax=Acetonema longum DSM 6540 TaxID=1009370 RepID=F7NK51_9FIRM|nr:hypothetical protein ALO_12321 [Acetonema longum DSM 6540]